MLPARLFDLPGLNIRRKDAIPVMTAKHISFIRVYWTIRGLPYPVHFPRRSGDVLTRVERLGIPVRCRIGARAFAAMRKRFAHVMANKGGMEFQSEIPTKST